MNGEIDRKRKQVIWARAGGDIRIGADILRRAALTDEFAAASGEYFDNDSGRFSAPHPDALDPQVSAKLVQAIEALLAETHLN